MTIGLAAAAANAAVNAITALLDSGGYLQFQTSAGAEVSKNTFATDSFGAASGGVATANAIASDATTVAGTVTKCHAKTAANAVVFQATVTATGGGGDITMPSTTFANNETLSVTSMTLTQAIGYTP